MIKKERLSEFGAFLAQFPPEFETNPIVRWLAVEGDLRAFFGFAVRRNQGREIRADGRPMGFSARIGDAATPGWG